ncbi:molybdopterin-dependent oxidoreductase [Catenuloplanes sp. NPDC051500]|uniref:molybdopterin-dependent oxidoreductase n=1 Tax=Catenuloplanes sp. NPDC051500 TaxID=3363959 RepID=UPI0037B7D6E7
MVRDPHRAVSPDGTAGHAASRRARGLTRTVIAWLATPLPPPPDQLRRGPWRDGAFTSDRRSTALTARLGVLLGLAFAVCFATGLLSHLIQHPPGWFWWPSRPVRLYQVTQGVHVATGLACVPLLGAKLWSVYPRLFTWPPARTPVHAAERASIGILVAAALFQLVSGVLNIALWYAPMPFIFTAGHYWVGWLAIGGLLIHVAVHLPVTRTALLPQSAGTAVPARREVLTAVGAAAGLITLFTVGQTLRPLAPLAVLTPRRPGTGPQGLPVNRTAADADVLDTARDPAYRLVVTGPNSTHHLSVADLAALTQHTVALPIACVEGWSATAGWTGVRVSDLIALTGADPRTSEVEVVSLEQHGAYRTSELTPPHTADPNTLLALRLNGEILDPDHGYPVRLIAPNRPGVLQTKWVGSITVRELP